jgi:hypothetical protein
LNGSATVSPGPSGITTFSFTTSLFTSKSGDSWSLAFTPPEGSSIRVILPEYSMLGGSDTAPTSVSASQYRPMLYFNPESRISLSYSLGPSPSSEDTPMALGQYILGASALLAIAAIAASYLIFLRKPQPRPASSGNAPPPSDTPHQPDLALTVGKKAMMETFNENDLKIVGFLLANQGKSRRNELERKCGISKSSLSMALNRLEKRKMIEIDRTSTTHFVKLSDAFLRL